jgi:hypothetical protein
MSPTEFIAQIGDYVAAQSNDDNLVIPMAKVKKMIDSVVVKND